MRLYFSSLVIVNGEGIKNISSNKFIDRLDSALEPFEYKFKDCSSEIKKRFYSKKKYNFLKLSDNTILEDDVYEYKISEDKLYIKDDYNDWEFVCPSYGMTTINNTTLKTMYKSLRNYKKHSLYLSQHYEKDSKTGAFGFFKNKDNIFDSYSIVSSTNINQLFMVKNKLNYVINPIMDAQTPDGYVWVAIAKVKDICWDKMYEYFNNKMESYRKKFNNDNKFNITFNDYSFSNNNFCPEYSYLFNDKGIIRMDITFDELYDIYQMMNKDDFLVSVNCNF